MTSQLIGSEKQVAWASKIRDEKLGFVKEALNKVFAEHVDAAIKSLEKIDKAKFWIENREATGLALGLYGATIAGIKLGLPEDKNFIYPWILKTTTKKKTNTGEFIIEKETEETVEDICFPIKFKKGYHVKAIEEWWYSYNSKIKKIQIYYKKPEITEDENLFLGTFRSFVNDAKKGAGWSTLSIAVAIMRIDKWGSFKLDLVMEP